MASRRPKPKSLTYCALTVRNSDGSRSSCGTLTPRTTDAFCARHAKLIGYTWSSIAPALPAPFKTADNGAHLYFEDKEVVVFCNHGSSLWNGFGKEDGGYQVLACGEEPSAVMAETRHFRAIPRADRADALSKREG